MIISIDGYSATGKSTLAELLAKSMGFRHLNSGLIYRAISYNLLTNGINNSNLQDKLASIKSLTQQLQIDLEELKINSQKLKTAQVGELGVQIAKFQFVRDRVTEILKLEATKSNIIVEGRDIGTVLFPNAELKFFFIADSTIRAKRVGIERNSNDIVGLKNEIENRDKEDENREISPLKRPDNAIVIDTSHIKIKETLKLLERYVNEYKK